VNPAPQRHYVALDAFRFIAALGIVLHHCAIYADAMGWQSHVTMFDNFSPLRRLFLRAFRLRADACAWQCDHERQRLPAFPAEAARAHFMDVDLWRGNCCIRSTCCTL
jgi:hypothetical protein